MDFTSHRCLLTAVRNNFFLLKPRKTRTLGPGLAPLSSQGHGHPRKFLQKHSKFDNVVAVRLWGRQELLTGGATVNHANRNWTLSSVLGRARSMSGVNNFWRESFSVSKLVGDVTDVILSAWTKYKKNTANLEASPNYPDSGEFGRSCRNTDSL